MVAAASSVSFASTAANSVASSRASDRVYAVTMEAFAPAPCAGMNLSNLVTGQGSLTGTNANDLILGGPDAQFIRGGPGDDCIVPGGGRDVVFGEQGYDVCITESSGDIVVLCEERH